MMKFQKVLIANRGEIALRVTRTLQEMGVEVVSVYTEPDADALHRRQADYAYPVDSYLDGAQLVGLARTVGAEAIHPGYGFLSENAGFAEACQQAGVKFIGPPVEAVRSMGDKLVAKSTMKKAGVPVVPSWSGPLEEASEGAVGVGFPLLVKAAAGGGGKGMRRVDHPEQLEDALSRAASEARKAFGDDRVFLEKYIERPRHVEIQILGDEHGRIVHLGERECSIQRRYQKIIEESPSPALGSALRQQMGEAAVRAAQAIGYTNAGTVEFILNPEGNFYFLEVNTRLQVEHPVTEMVYGVDLVRLQVEVAQGCPLPFEQRQLVPMGAAIECRVYAEDPATGFLPSIGKVGVYEPPVGPGIRVDSGIEQGSEVTVHFDPMLAKLVVWASDREQARQKMLWALSRFVVLGVTTNIEFLARVTSHPEFAAGNTTTGFLDEYPISLERDRPLLAAALAHIGPEFTSPAAIGQALTAEPWKEMGGWRL